jgi:hypothetical protein
MDGIRQRFNEIAIVAACAIARAEQAILEARLEIERIDELLERTKAIRRADDKQKAA